MTLPSPPRLGVEATGRATHDAAMQFEHLAAEWIERFARRLQELMPDLPSELALAVAEADFHEQRHDEPERAAGRYAWREGDPVPSGY